MLFKSIEFDKGLVSERKHNTFSMTAHDTERISQHDVIPQIIQNMDVSENSGTPKSSILIGFSIINHPFWVPLFLETPIYTFPSSKLRTQRPALGTSWWWLVGLPAKRLAHTFTFTHRWDDRITVGKTEHLKLPAEKPEPSKGGFGKMINGIFWVIKLVFQKKEIHPPKTNRSPQHWCLEDDSCPFQTMVPFQVTIRSFSETKNFNFTCAYPFAQVVEISQLLCTQTMIIARMGHGATDHLVVLWKAVGQTGDRRDVQLGTRLWHWTLRQGGSKKSQWIP